MSQHVKSCLWLVSWYHVSSVVNKHKPQIVINFGPTLHLAMDSPDLLLCSLPCWNTFPIQGIQVVQDPRSIDDVVILSIVDQSSDIVLEQPNHVTCIGPRQISSKVVLNAVIDYDKSYILRHSELLLVLVQKSIKRKIFISILPEVKNIHSSEIFVLGIGVIIIHEKVDKEG